MQWVSPSIISTDTTGRAFLGDRVHFTQKEVHHVQQTAESIAEFLLRRLRSHWEGPRSGGAAAAPGVPSLDSINALAILPIHKSVALHAAALQLFAYSGGVLADPTLLPPLWLTLMLRGKGLRRMHPASLLSANRATALIGIENLEDIARRFVRDPWTAYRLGLYGLAIELLDATDGGSRAGELRLRVHLAMNALGESAVGQVDQLADGDRSLRISLLSTAAAYHAKERKAPPSAVVHELESWLNEARSHAIDADPVLVAQVMNAVNLVYLTTGPTSQRTTGNAGLIEANMAHLLSEVTPRIADAKRRAHIEGNAHYQRSILARKDGDQAGEVDALVLAFDRDSRFGTLFYRLAQVFHDRGDARAELFYEMALALSPLDLPTANDYGCYLASAGKARKFESWSTLCRALFPEQFTESAAVGGSA